MIENPTIKNILIIGAGLAGTTLALELIQRELNVSVIDNPQPNSSSRTAAGILNPLVPRNVMKTWKCDSIFPEVFTYFKRWEKTFHAEFIDEFPTLQIHKIPNHTKNWKKRSKEKGFKDLIAPLEENQFESLNLPFEAAWCQQTGRLNVTSFLEFAHRFLHENSRSFIHAQVDYSEFKPCGEHWVYQNKEYDSIVFCEGVGMLQNPFFNGLPLNPSGGDILRLSIKGLNPNYTYKRKEWLVPIGNDEWLAGSTYRSGDLSTIPLEENAELILSELEKWIPQPMELLEHKTAPRPTVGTRRPFMGEHPNHKGLFVYNGLGSKGSSLCSWLSPLYADYISSGKNELPAEVEINQYF